MASGFNKGPSGRGGVAQKKTVKNVSATTRYTGNTGKNRTVSPTTRVTNTKSSNRGIYNGNSLMQQAAVQRRNTAAAQNRGGTKSTTTSQSAASKKAATQRAAQEAARQAQERGRTLTNRVNSGTTSGGARTQTPVQHTNSRIGLNTTTTNNSGGYSSYRSYSSGGSGGSSSSATEEQTAAQEAAERAAAQAAALAAARQARIEAINAANGAIDQQTAALIARYNNSMGDVTNDYQDLINQNNVNRYRDERMLLERAANRGDTGSGLSRTERLALATNYNNNENKINQNRESELATIRNNIAQAQASAAQQKAANQVNGLNDYNSALNSIISATYSGYTPTNSDYYKAAQQAIGNVLAQPTGINTIGSDNSVSNLAAAIQQKQNQDNTYVQLLRAMGYQV